ncbi:hypothetical protein N431DRAFT_490676 [Stipitochalara longipes BDJ]|nr:hypothetical protein N431DRAFT_490676 [Stipitochalara longipes BDJ]
MATTEISKKRKREPHFTDSESLVTFLVGPCCTPKKFIIHKERVCQRSLVLKAALNGNFIEGQTQTYRFEDTSPGAFRLFAQWIYEQKLDLYQLKDMEERLNDVRYDLPNPNDLENMELVELWVLADKIAMPALQNQVMTKIVEIRNAARDEVAVKTLHYIYEVTSVNNPLRLLMVSEVALYSRQHVFAKSSEVFPYAFLIDLAIHNAVLFRPGHEDFEDTVVSETFGDTVGNEALEI